MLTAGFYIPIVRWAAPTTFMLGSAPTFFALWWVWRISTAVLPNRVYQAGDDYLFALYQRMLLFYFEHANGLELVLYGDGQEVMKKKENVIYICNHQSTADWLVAEMLAVRQGSLGRIRFILKNGLRWFPMYGYYFRQHSCIYVKRSGKFREDVATEQLQDLVRRDCPFWMVIFPEGTRVKEELLQKSEEYAKKEGLPSYKYMLVPRTKALQLCLQELKGKIDALYDVTIGYSQEENRDIEKFPVTPGLIELLGRSSKQVHILVNRFPISEIPDSDEELRKWITERFNKKDELMSKFYAGDGTLGPDGSTSSISYLKTVPAMFTFLALGSLAIGTQRGRDIYWKVSLLGTLAGWAWMTVTK